MKIPITISIALLLSSCISRKSRSDTGSEDSGSFTDTNDTSTDSDADTDSGTDNTVDIDGDGYTSALDCDDNNPEIHPGAEELCDNVDNNCDGVENDPNTASFELNNGGWQNLDPQTMVPLTTEGVGSYHFCEGTFPLRLEINHDTYLFGHGNVTLSGESQHKIVLIQESVNVNIHDLNFRDGSSSFGGSIECSAPQENSNKANLNLQNISVNNSTANKGGALGLRACDTVIRNSTFNENTSIDGGGTGEGYGAVIYSNESVIDSDSNIYKRSNGYRAAIYIRSSEGNNFVNDQFLENEMDHTSALMLGVGTLDSAAKASLTNTSFKDNKSENDFFAAVSVRLGSEFDGSNINFSNNSPKDVHTEQQDHSYNGTVSILCDSDGCIQR